MSLHRQARRRTHRRNVVAEGPEGVVRKRQTGFIPTAHFPQEQGKSDPTPVPSSNRLPATPAAVADTTPTTSAPTRTPTISNIFPPIVLSSSTSTTPRLSTSTSAPTSTSTTKLTTPSVISTTDTQISAAPSTTQRSTQTTTFVTASRAAATSSVPSISSSATAASSGTGGKIIGGVFGALGALVAICIIVAFIMRRWRKRFISREATNFDPGNFRRSAVILQDPEPGNNRAHTPRPPSMIERRMQTSTPLPFGAQYNHPGSQAQTGYGATQQYQQPYYQQYNTAMSPPNSANPLMQGTPSPFTPSPISPTYSQHGLLEQSNLGPGPYLTRTNSVGSQGSNNNRSSNGSLPNPHTPQYADFTPANPNIGTPVPTGEYVDVTRSSVTPFQQAQYAAISQRLQTAPPQGLDTPAVEAYVQSRSRPQTPVSRPPTPLGKELPSSPSPFSDPESPTTHESVNSIHEFDPRTLDFPIPPPSPLTSITSSRIASPPPTLPEIRVDSRGSFGSYDFPSSVNHTPVSSVFPSGIGVTPFGVIGGTAANGQAMAPSPLASSFIIEPQSPVRAETAKAAAMATVTPTPLDNTNKKRPETVYDDEDVYGGI